MTEAVIDQPKTYSEATEEMRRICRAEFVAGKGYTPQIAARHNLSPHTVKGWLNDGGWVQLRERREQAELAKLAIGLLPTEQIPIPPRHELSEVEILQGHIRDTDEQLRDCKDAKERAMLARARTDFSDDLFKAIHGARAGTLRPKQGKPERPRDVAPVEAPVEQQQIATVPAPVLDSFAGIPYTPEGGEQLC